jgi:hypothetical protein
MNWEFIATKEINHNKFDFTDTDNPDVKIGVFGFFERGGVNYPELTFEDVMFQFFLGKLTYGFHVTKVIRKLEDSELTESCKNISNNYKNCEIVWYECEVFLINKFYIDLYNYEKVKQLVESKANGSFNLNPIWEHLLFLKLKETFSEEVYMKFLKLKTLSRVSFDKPKSFKERCDWYNKIENITPVELACNFYTIN